MDWALQFDGVNDYTTLDSAIFNPIPVGDSLIYTGTRGSSVSSLSMFVNVYQGARTDVIAFNSTGQLRVRVDGVIMTGATLVSVGEDFILRIDRDLSSYKAYINGVLQFTINKTVDMSELLGFCQSNFNYKGDLKTVELTGYGNYWDATASSHTAGTPILLDTVGGNNATGVNMPTDGSAWVDLVGSGETIILDSGSYSISGTDSNLLVSSLVSAESGSYFLTGADTQLKSSLIITTESGIYTLSGSDAEILAARKVIVETGFYSLNGSDVTLTVTGEAGVIITLDPGEYSFTGENKPLYINYIVGAQSANYTINGTELNLLYNRAITIDSGNYGIAGTDLAFKTDYVIIPESVNYSLTGKSVTLIYSNEQKQVIGNVTASYKDSGITTNFKENSITVRFN